MRYKFLGLVGSRSEGTVHYIESGELREATGVVFSDTEVYKIGDGSFVRLSLEPLEAKPALSLVTPLAMELLTKTAKFTKERDAAFG